MAERQLLDANPPLLLALECATEGLGVALWRPDRGVVVEAPGAPGLHHAESLLPTIEGALDEEGVGLSQVGGFAIAIGPGSFTSLRVGLATLKALAFDDRRPVVPVSTLEALAWPALSAAEAPVVAALLDARRGEFYAAAYGVGESEGEECRVELAETVATPDELAESLPRGALLVGEALDDVESALARCGRSDLRARRPHEAGLRASAIAELGGRRWQRGLGQTVSSLVPRYLRRPEAEVKRTGIAFDA